jgi:hypothetical protein
VMINRQLACMRVTVVRRPEPAACVIDVIVDS